MSEANICNVGGSANHVPSYEAYSPIANDHVVCINLSGIKNRCITVRDVESSACTGDSGLANASTSGVPLKKYCNYNRHKIHDPPDCNSGLINKCTSLVQVLSRTLLFPPQSSGNILSHFVIIV